MARRALGLVAFVCFLATTVMVATAHETPITPPPSPSDPPPPSEASPPSSTQPAPQPAPSTPPVPEGSGSGRRIVYSNSQQRVWLVEDDGRVDATYLVSGRRRFPRAGTYSVLSKSRHSRSGSLRLEYMVRFARTRGLTVGFHSIPIGRRGPIQSESQLGTPRSRGCVRQSRADALHLWDWAPMGTRVVVTR